MQKTKHHPAAVPAVSSSSQNSSFTALQHSHSNAAAEQEMEDISSKAPHRGSVAPVTAALQHSRSNAASEHDAALLHAHAHAQPMQVGQAASLALCCDLGIQLSAAVWRQRQSSKVRHMNPAVDCISGPETQVAVCLFGMCKSG